MKFTLFHRRPEYGPGKTMRHYYTVEDPCCEQFKELVEYNKIGPDLILSIERTFDEYDSDSQDFKLAYCPFCGKKIELCVQ